MWWNIMIDFDGQQLARMMSFVVYPADPAQIWRVMMSTSLCLATKRDLFDAYFNCCKCKIFVYFVVVTSER